MKPLFSSKTKPSSIAKTEPYSLAKKSPILQPKRALFESKKEPYSRARTATYRNDEFLCTSKDGALLPEYRSPLLENRALFRVMSHV